MKDKFNTAFSKLSLSVDEAAEALSTSRQTIYDVINAGELDSYKVGKRRFVSTAACQRYIEAQEAKTRKEREAAA